MKRLPQIVVVIIGILLAGTAASCSSGSSSEAPLYSAKDATKVTAEELFAAYAKKPKAADKLYTGKLLQVSGVIGDLGTDPIFGDAPELVLAGGVMNQTRGVDCIFDERYASEVAKLKTGQTTTVLGVCDGYAVNVLLLHCQPAQE